MGTYRKYSCRTQVLESYHRKCPKPKYIYSPEDLLPNMKMRRVELEPTRTRKMGHNRRISRGPYISHKNQNINEESKTCPQKIKSPEKLVDIEQLKVDIKIEMMEEDMSDPLQDPLQLTPQGQEEDEISYTHTDTSQQLPNPPSSHHQPLNTPTTSYQSLQQLHTIGPLNVQLTPQGQEEDEPSYTHSDASQQFPNPPSSHHQPLNTPTTSHQSPKATNIYRQQLPILTPLSALTTPLVQPLNVIQESETPDPDTNTLNELPNPPSTLQQPLTHTTSTLQQLPVLKSQTSSLVQPLSDIQETQTSNPVTNTLKQLLNSPSTLQQPVLHTTSTFQQLPVLESHTTPLVQPLSDIQECEMPDPDTNTLNELPNSPSTLQESLTHTTSTFQQLPLLTLIPHNMLNTPDVQPISPPSTAQPDSPTTITTTTSPEPLNTPTTITTTNSPEPLDTPSSSQLATKTHTTYQHNPCACLNLSETPIVDKFHRFGLSVASDLRSLSLPKALTLQRKIKVMLVQAKREKLKENVNKT